MIKTLKYIGAFIATTAVLLIISGIDSIVEMLIF